MRARAGASVRWGRLPRPSARDEPEVSPDRGPALALQRADQRRAGAVEHLAHRRLGTRLRALHRDCASAAEPQPEDAAQVPATARSVHVLDPELHPPQMTLEPTQRIQEVAFTELPEPGADGEVTGAQLELHACENRRRGDH